MDTIIAAFHFFLHIDQYLQSFASAHGHWIYLLLFIIIFCETGLVITPFLPGDSLLFAAGSLAAITDLNINLLALLLITAAILGDSVNYAIGHWIGPRIFQKKNSKFFKQEYLHRAHIFYKKYGGKAIVIGRFFPIMRTFVPFIAGIGTMNYKKFLFYNVIGAIFWVCLFLYASYFFGSIPIVKNNFTIVIMAIILLSVIPLIIEYCRHKRLVKCKTK